MQEKIKNDYFRWMFDLVCGNRYSKKVSYRKLLAQLHDIKFRYIIEMDANRAEAGIDLRYRYDHDYAELYLDGPCSVLEMMVALAIHCEESIMDDPSVGDRTGQWFWEMITSLGLGSMTDNNYDKRYVAMTIERFLNRDYEPNGRGGLFTVRNCDRDLREVEIYYQLCYYLDTII